MSSIQEPDIPLVYLSPPASHGSRFAVVAPMLGESMVVLLRQVRALPGYQQLWRGAPSSILEVRAKVWVMYQPNHLGYKLQSNGYMDYRDPKNPSKRKASARDSFASAIVMLSEFVGALPKEVVVILLN